MFRTESQSSFSGRHKNEEADQLVSYKDSKEPAESLEQCSFYLQKGDTTRPLKICALADTAIRMEIMQQNCKYIQHLNL